MESGGGAGRREGVDKEKDRLGREHGSVYPRSLKSVSPE